MTAPDLRLALTDLNTIPNNPVDDHKPRHSWIPASLITLAKTPPAPPTIGNLLYPGKRTLLSGETESLKTWLALILAKAEMQIETPVAWVDLDDMGAGAILQRLRALQIADKTINDFFFYYQPDQRLYNTQQTQRTEQFTDVLMNLTITGARLMIIDAFNPMLSLHGLDPNSTPDIETFWREIADPIAKTGAAPVLLDHVAKNAETRGKYSYGSERKASGATVHIGANTLEALTIGGEGRAILTVHKDRPAYLPRPTIGILKLVSHPTGNTETIEYTLEPDRSHTPGGHRPTVLMEKVSRYLEQQHEPLPMWELEQAVTGKRDAIRNGVTLLVQGGYIDQTRGPRNSRLLTTSSPYRQDEDTVTNDLAPTSPHLAPKLGLFGVSTTSPPPSSLTGEGEVVGTTTPPGRTEQNGTSPHVTNPDRDRLPFNALLDTEPEETT